MIVRARDLGGPERKCLLDITGPCTPAPTATVVATQGQYALTWEERELMNSHP